jgi:copper transporter 1
MTKSLLGNSSKPMTFRPNALQQMVRALMHVLQFALAYVIKLLAMYYNGYVIICIFIGAFVGFFLFDWESITLEGPREDAVVCCG